MMNLDLFELAIVAMSALPPKADIAQPRCNVCFLPKPEVTTHQRLAKGRPFAK